MSILEGSYNRYLFQWPLLEREPAPSEQRRRPISGAGFAPVLEPAPIIVGPAPDIVRPALGIGTEGNRPDVGYSYNYVKNEQFFENDYLWALIDIQLTH